MISSSAPAAATGSEPRSQLLQDGVHPFVVELLPLGRHEAVAILLGKSRVLSLLFRRRVVDVAVGIAGDKSEFLRRPLLDVQSDLDAQFSRKRNQHEVPDS